MGSKPTIRIKGEHITFPRLWSAAAHFRELGDETPVGSYFEYLAASVFTYFAFEGFLNEIGRLVDPVAWQNERKFFTQRGSGHVGTLGKLDYLAAKAGWTIDKNAAEYRSVEELQGARNFLGHHRSELFDAEYDADEYADVDTPAPEMDTYAQKGFVDRVMRDVETVSDALLRAARATFPHQLEDRGTRAFSGGITGSFEKTRQVALSKLPTRR